MTDWKDEIEEHMTTLSDDVGCFRTLRVDNMSATNWSYGVVFGNGDEYGDGGCWSAVGMAAGFYGYLNKTISQLGAPAYWQVISRVVQPEK